MEETYKEVVESLINLNGSYQVLRQVRVCYAQPVSRQRRPMNPLLPTTLNLFSIYKPLSHSLPACLNEAENPMQDIPQVPGSNNNTRLFYNGGPLLVYFREKNLYRIPQRLVKRFVTLSTCIKIYLTKVLVLFDHITKLLLACNDL